MTLQQGYHRLLFRFYNVTGGWQYLLEDNITFLIPVSVLFYNPSSPNTTTISTGSRTLATTGLSNGTNSMTTGALSCGAITSSGTFSNGTNSMTCGAIISSGTFSNGTNTVK